MSDINEDDVRRGPQNISVVLPDETGKHITVDADTPMRDVLVTVSKKFKLKPAEVRMELREDSGRVLDYNANQTIGSMRVDNLYVMNKIGPRAEREQNRQKHKEASQFEITQRVVVTIGRSSNKHILRLNPNVPIIDLYKRICVDKNLDVSRYEVKLTNTPKIPVDMSLTLDDYNTRDISLLPCSDGTNSAPEFHSSMVDISHREPTFKNMQSDNRTSTAALDKVKKKKGLLAFFSRNKKSKKLDESRSPSVQTLPSSNESSILNKPRAQVKPQAQVQPTIREEVEDNSLMKIERKPSSKKKRAPAPPSQRPMSMMAAIPESNKSIMYSSTPNLLSSTSNKTTNTVTKSRRQPIQLHTHSRNSSDSSGYHEQLSPNSSPSDTSTLPRNKTQKASIIENPRPQSAIVQRSQTLPSAVGGVKKIKKKAPAPPILIEAQTTSQAAPFVPSFLHESVIESEDETDSISSRDDASIHGPLLGVITPSGKGPPPIFIPPPPPETPPPDISQYSPVGLRRELSKTPTSAGEEPAFMRSESRCSRTSVDTMDDIQFSFNQAIAAGEEGLRDTPEGGGSRRDSLRHRASRPDSGTDQEVSRIADRMSTLTDKLKTSPQITRRSEPSQDEINAAVAQLDFNLESGNTSSTASAESSPHPPDISNHSAQGHQGSVRSNYSLNSIQRGYVKPVEEISYGRFDNPFRGQVNPVVDTSNINTDVTSRRDSEISDSTLPDSELTDRAQSASLQSSVLQSDNEEVTETGDGYETTGTEKALSQSETENEVKLRRKTGRSLEVRQEDVDKVIRGDVEAGSVRGIPGQVKHRSASFDKEPTAVRPSTVYGILQTARVTSDAPKRRSMYSVVQQEAANVRPEPKQPPPVANKPRHPTNLKQNDSKPQSLHLNTNTGAKINNNVSTRPLPVYKRVNSNKTPDETRPLASLIKESITSGESSKPRRTTPEGGPQTMFFGARRVNTSNPSKVVIENRIKLDPKYESNVKTVRKPEDVKLEPSPVITVDSVDNPAGSSAKELKRKESLKEQYKKMQSNIAMWHDKLKENENKVKTLTASQQNLSTSGTAFNSASSAASGSAKTAEKSNGMVKSSTTNELENKLKSPTNHYQSMPSELHQVTLKSAARRVIEKPPPELGVVDLLMHSIRERGGKTSDDGPDRGIYVATGDLDSMTNDHVTVREVAPSVLDKSVPVPAPPIISNRITSNNKTVNNNNYRKSTGSVDKSNDSRFKQQIDPRENLLDEIKNRNGKPKTRRRATIELNGADSSSQSSSDELRELEIRRKPTKSNKPRNKRSISDPFPPQSVSGRRNVQPQSTQLNAREELMIAIRNSGGLNTLRQVHTDEIRWSAQV